MVMRYRIITALFLILICLPTSEGYAKPSSEEEINNVLTSAEALFKAIRDKQHVAIWTMITETTKKKIVDSTYRELKKAGNQIQKESIEADFHKGDVISKAYWEGYLLIFNPQIVLEQSRWTIGMIGRDKAEINIQFKKTKYPAILKLFKENDQWKVGLDETFGARSLLMF